jgi:hypothetical protein
VIRRLGASTARNANILPVPERNTGLQEKMRAAQLLKEKRTKNMAEQRRTGKNIWGEGRIEKENESSPG